MAWNKCIFCTLKKWNKCIFLMQKRQNKCKCRNELIGKMTKIGIKSMEKMTKLLHISKKSSTFAADLVFAIREQRTLREKAK